MHTRENAGGGISASEVVCDNYNLQSLLFTSPPLSNQLSHWIIYIVCVCMHCATTLHCSITKAIPITRWRGRKEKECMFHNWT